MSGTAANLGVAEIADRFPEVTIVLGHGGLATEQDDAYRTAGSAALAAGPTSSSRSRLWHRAPTQVGRPRACGHGCWAPSTPSARSGRCWPPTLADPPAARELRRTCQRLPLDHRPAPAHRVRRRPAGTASGVYRISPEGGQAEPARARPPGNGAELLKHCAPAFHVATEVDVEAVLSTSRRSADPRSAPSARRGEGVEDLVVDELAHLGLSARPGEGDELVAS